MKSTNYSLIEIRAKNLAINNDNY